MPTGATLSRVTSAVPVVTAAQMRRVDDVAIVQFGLALTSMMENAGRNLADAVILAVSPRTATVLVGPGHNGGGGLVAARHLANRGVSVKVVLVRRERLSSATARQLAIVSRAGIDVSDEPSKSDVTVDALLGYSLDGSPRGRMRDFIAWSRNEASPVVSLDVPSGVDPTDGLVRGDAVRASLTVTLALPKAGLAIARALVGTLYLADIGIPPAVYAAMGLDAPTLFRSGSLVRLIAHGTGFRLTPTMAGETCSFVGPGVTVRGCESTDV